MKKGVIFIITIMLTGNLMAQETTADTVRYANVVIKKDARVDVLGEKMLAYNIGLSKNIRSGKGYRLMVLSTNDRNLAMQLRSKLLQQYPEHKVYMIYQNPFIKLKMGNFVEKEEAENFKKQLLKQKIMPGNIYVLPENIELKPEIEEVE
ncbi:MAG: SPOR domain-containing protein [Ferruginibacter sp.]